MKEIAYMDVILANIDNIIFDLGGVVANIDYLETQRAFEVIGLFSFGEVYSGGPSRYIRFIRKWIG
ncbi:MAG: hypothetical protein LBG19_12450 [Prevotellaceae bacterium]|jgi:hypothetical protein|nr:hypothetical protein [Prevotellaceae bacterium]